MLTTQILHVSLVVILCKQCIYAERNEGVDSSVDECRENDILHFILLQHTGTVYLPFRQGQF